MILANSRVRRFSRGRVILPLAVLLTGGILTADASSSEAAGQQAAASCTLNVASRVAISSPYTNPTFTLGADCAAAGVIDARWEAKRADGVVMKKAFFNFSYPASWAVFDTTSLAPWTWHPAGARTRSDTTLATDGEPTPGAVGTSEQIEATVPQNTPTTDIRMMSKVEALETTLEEAEKCIASVWAQRYAIAPHGLINYGGRTGSIQQLNQTSGGWFVLGSFTTGSDGRWKGQIANPGAGTTQSRRVVIYDGQYIFGSISPTYTGVPIHCDPAGTSLSASEPSALGLNDPQVEVNNEDPGPLPEPPADR